jgi:hypothetical protein
MAGSSKKTESSWHSCLRLRSVRQGPRDAGRVCRRCWSVYCGVRGQPISQERERRAVECLRLAQVMSDKTNKAPLHQIKWQSPGSSAEPDQDKKEIIPKAQRTKAPKMSSAKAGLEGAWRPFPSGPTCQLKGFAPERRVSEMLRAARGSLSVPPVAGQSR